jgi:hypothetical protein
MVEDDNDGDSNYSDSIKVIKATKAIVNLKRQKIINFTIQS